MEILYLVLIFLCWTLLGTITSKLAVKRGKNPYIWFYVGFFLGVLGILALYLIPKTEKVEKKVQDPKPPVKQKPLQLWYYLDKNHTQQGPYSETYLEEKLSKKELCENTYVWNENLSDWKKVKELDKLFDLVK